MAKKKKPKKQNMLLTPEDRMICQRIATRDDQHGRRAMALLLLDEGLTQVEASKRAKIGVGRIRYGLTFLRREGLAGIFPEDILKED